MNKSKIIKYLKTKRNEEYNYLDVLLDKYCTEELFVFLSKFQFTTIEIFPAISKRENFMEICLSYQNIAVNIVLMQEELEYSIYQFGADIDEVNENTFSIIYDENFSFEELINSIFEKMASHSKLKNISKEKKKKKIYAMISSISLCLPVLVICILALYTFAADKEIKLNGWFSLVIIIPMITYSIFDVKSKRNK